MTTKIEQIKTESYKAELELLIDKMLAAESFAEKLPFFKEVIIRDKLNEKQNSNFGSSFKDIYLGHSIYRRACKFSDITNFEYEFGKQFEGEKVLNKIYINTYSLYDSNEKFDLYDFITSDFCFFIDKLNSTFYVEDHNIEVFFDKYRQWIAQAISRSEELEKQKQIKELEKKLSKLKSEQL